MHKTLFPKQALQVRVRRINRIRNLFIIGLIAGALVCLVVQ